MDKLKNFCDHTMIMHDPVRNNLLVIGSFCTPQPPLGLTFAPNEATSRKTNENGEQNRTMETHPQYGYGPRLPYAHQNGLKSFFRVHTFYSCFYSMQKSYFAGQVRRTQVHKIHIF